LHDIGTVTGSKVQALAPMEDQRSEQVDELFPRFAIVVLQTDDQTVMGMTG
jgi:hypothetical protein